MARRGRILPFGLVVVLLVAPGCSRSETDRLLAEGQRLYDEEQYAAAVETFVRAAESDPDNPDALFSLASVQYAVGSYDLALAAIDRALVQRTTEADYSYLRGNVLTRLERYDEAVEAYEAIVEQSPEFTRAYYALGLAYYNKREYSKAVTWLERYLEVEPRGDDRERVRALIDYLDG